jgi:Vitamin K-dependent gamma-carboxylase
VEILIKNWPNSNTACCSTAFSKISNPCCNFSFDRYLFPAPLLRFNLNKHYLCARKSRKVIHKAYQWLCAPHSIAPLVVLRILFGLLTLYSTVRFWVLGWIRDHYLDSKVQFKYFGFEWVQLLPPAGMYALHAGMLAGSLGVLLGYRYQWSALLFFLCFTYTELIDLTYYLNHYYFVSIVAFLMIFVPAHRRFSLDVRRNPALAAQTVPRWTVLIFQVQLGIVYVYAGLAKINYDWLVAALPLRIWLPAHDTMPVLGPLFAWRYTPWLFSWAGMLYDVTIVFWLIWPRTRWVAYASVLVFHGLTGLLFQIGVFPLVMAGVTWIFFSDRFHERLLRWLGNAPPPTAPPDTQKLHGNLTQPWQWGQRLTVFLAVVFMAFQVVFPWRYLLYPGNVCWTEEGYRFSWRVMLMEKAGTATFYVKDTRTGREGVVNNGDFLCAHQEKQMAMQPDMILQYAHFLAKYYADRGVYRPAVRAEVYITLNGSPSRLYFDPNTDLTLLQDTWKHKHWIYP